MRENYYEKNKLDVIMLHKDTYVFRKENVGIDTSVSKRGLGFIEYLVSIDGVEAPIPKSFFLSLLEKNEGCNKFIQYKFLDENYETQVEYELI